MFCFSATIGYHRIGILWKIEMIDMFSCCLSIWLILIIQDPFHLPLLTKVCSDATAYRHGMGGGIGPHCSQDRRFGWGHFTAVKVDGLPLPSSVAFS